MAQFGTVVKVSELNESYIGRNVQFFYELSNPHRLREGRIESITDSLITVEFTEQDFKSFKRSGIRGGIIVVFED